MNIKLNKKFEMLIQYLAYGEQSVNILKYYFFNVNSSSGCYIYKVTFLSGPSFSHELYDSLYK